MSKSNIININQPQAESAEPAYEEADKAIYWLLQFYYATTRQGWEKGMTEKEVSSAIVSFLANRELDPNTNKANVKEFIQHVEENYDNLY